jgi:hypothetical protein
MGRKSVIETRIKQLESELQELDKYGDDIYEDGTVIRFKYAFTEATSVSCLYTFAALKVKGSWYLTGSKFADRFTWDDLVSFWNRGIVRKMRIATEWEKF